MSPFLPAGTDHESMTTSIGIKLSMAKADHYEHVSPSTPDEGPGPDMPSKDSDHADTESLRRWKTSMRKRIGTYGLVVVIGGIPFQLGIMTFLGYLWSQQARGESETGQTVWRTIVLHAWMAPTITLCSVVLRAIVGVQLVVCTALLAGLMLETGASRFEDAARLSILRAYNSGPLDIVLLAVQRLPKIRLSMPELIAAALLLVGTALQFASTLLVSGLGDAVIPSDPESRRVPVVDRSGLFVQANGHYMWTKHPGVWPTTASWERTSSTPAQSDGRCSPLSPRTAYSCGPTRASRSCRRQGQSACRSTWATRA